MDASHENPIKRFSAFWIVLLLLVIFAVASFVFGFFDKNGVSDMESVSAQDRQAIHQRVNQEQTEALNPENLQKARQEMLGELIDSKPEAGSMPVAGAAKSDDQEKSDKEAGKKASPDAKSADQEKPAEQEKSGEQEKPGEQEKSDNQNEKKEDASAEGGDKPADKTSTES